MISMVSRAGAAAGAGLLSVKSTSRGLCLLISTALRLSSFSMTWSRSLSLAYKSLFFLKKSKSVAYSA